MSKEVVLDLIVSPRDIRTYRASIAQALNGILPAIFLQQVVFHWVNKENQAFYKFDKPCDNPLYRVGDSWQEELFFSRRDLENVRNLLATKVSNNSELEIAMQSEELNHCIIYMKNSGNVTYYYVNVNAVYKLWENISECSKRAFANAQNEHSGMLKTSIRITENTIEDQINTQKDSLFDNEISVMSVPKEISLKPTKPKQTKYDKNGKRISDSFRITPAIIEEAKTLGYEQTDITSEGTKFLHYYRSGNGKHTKLKYWKTHFLNEWLNNAYHFGNIRRNGQFYKTSTSDGYTAAYELLKDPNFLKGI